VSATALRAMVLAAGFGARLRPLTDLMPKPLMPVANRPLIHYNLALLATYGVRDVMVNVHHHAAMIEQTLGNEQYGVRLQYSPEKVILGTGGGIVRARPFFKEEAFFLFNGDMLTSVDLAALLQFHQRQGAVATIVVRPLPAHAGYTPLAYDETGFVVDFKGVKRPARGAVRTCMFVGVHVLSPVIFEFLPSDGFACINEIGYVGMLKKGLPVAAFVDQGPWFDTGTPATYLEANRAVLSGRAQFLQIPPPSDAGATGVLVGQNVVIDDGVKLGPEVAIGDRCHIGKGATIARSVLWPGVTIKPKAQIESSIVALEHTVVVS
jgi:mannose-1-phosphate guanylyltransferase